MTTESTALNDGRDAMETDIAGLLSELSAVQTDLLNVLSHKRALLAKGDGAGLGATAAEEQKLAARLQACHDRREKMLAQAALCLALDPLAPCAGSLTPSTAMAVPLLARLRAAGLTFAIPVLASP